MHIALYAIGIVILTMMSVPFLIGRYIFGWLRFSRRFLQHYGHLVSHYWGLMVVKLARVKVEVTGHENIPQEEAVVFVGNHQGNFDIPVVLGFINKPKGFLAKAELVKVPIIRPWMKAIQCVFIDRGDIRKSIKSIQQCIDVVKGGQSLVIFPEGTRSKGPEMSEFKKGSLRVAERSGAPVVPVTINGTYKIMEDTAGRINRAKVSLIIAPPIYFDKLTKEEQGRFHDIVRETIARNLEQS